MGGADFLSCAARVARIGLEAAEISQRMFAQFIHRWLAGDAGIGQAGQDGEQWRGGGCKWTQADLGEGLGFSGEARGGSAGLVWGHGTLRHLRHRPQGRAPHHCALGIIGFAKRIVAHARIAQRERRRLGKSPETWMAKPPLVCICCQCGEPRSSSK